MASKWNFRNRDPTRNSNRSFCIKCSTEPIHWQWLHLISCHCWWGDIEMFDFNFSNIFLMFWKSFAIFLSWTLWSHAVGGYWKNNLCHNWAQAWGADQRKCQPKCASACVCAWIAERKRERERESRCVSERKSERKRKMCVLLNTCTHVEACMWAKEGLKQLK